MENTLNNLPIYRHNNERGVLISTQETDRHGNIIIEFIPLTNENIMAKIQSGELKCELSYDDIHDNNNTYSGEKNIRHGNILEPIKGDEIIGGWASEDFLKKDFVFRNLYILSDKETATWCSARRFMVDHLVLVLKEKPEENKLEEILSIEEKEWMNIVKENYGNVDDEQLQFTELIDEALAEINDK